MAQVFGCPNCQNPFQVPDDAAGDRFQCPTCDTTVEVPAADVPAEAPEEADIFSCPLCGGEFGVDDSMHGQRVACPHCEQLVSIGVVEESVAAPRIDTDEDVKLPDEVPSIEDDKRKLGAASPATAVADQAKSEKPIAPPPEPVFEPLPVDHLLPPRCDVPDPVRFPTRPGSDEVILPDGDGGYQSVEANVVTITHKGQVYHLKRLAPEERRRRKIIHNTIMIAVAIGLIYLTLRVLGVFT